jgi:hypothetical protein
MTVRQIGVIGLRGPDGTVYEDVPVYEQVPEGGSNGKAAADHSNNTTGTLRN